MLSGKTFRAELLLNPADVLILWLLIMDVGDQLADLLTGDRFGAQGGGFALCNDQIHQPIEVLFSKFAFQNIEQGEGVMVGDSRGVTLAQPVQGTGRNIWSIIHKVHFRCQKALVRATVQKSTRYQG